jgi:hypothetical protein
MIEHVFTNQRYPVEKEKRRQIVWSLLKLICGSVDGRKRLWRPE